MKTQRQQIVELLADQEMTARELAREMGLPLTRVHHELEHVARSLGQALEIRPARCLSCGFVYRKRTRLTTPSRCPKCRSERTEGPWLSVSSD